VENGAVQTEIGMSGAGMLWSGAVSELNRPLKFRSTVSDFAMQYEAYLTRRQKSKLLPAITRIRITDLAEK